MNEPREAEPVTIPLPTPVPLNIPPEVGAATWRVLLENDPRDRIAARALERQARAANVLSDLLFALECSRAAARGTDEGREATRELIQLYRDGTGDWKEALQLANGLWDESPGDASLRALLEEWAVAKKPGSREALALLERAAPTPEEKARLHARRGEPITAFRARLEAFRLHPEDAAVREALEQSARPIGALEEVARAYEAVLEENPSLDLKGALLGQLVVLYGDELGAPGKGLEAAEALVALGPIGGTEPSRLLRLRRRMGRSESPMSELSLVERRAETLEELEARMEARATEERWDEAARLLTQLVGEEQAEPSKRAAWRLRLANVKGAHLFEFEGPEGVCALLRPMITGTNPLERTRAIEQLDSLARDEKGKIAIAALLAEGLEKSGAFERLVELNEERVGWSESASERKELLITLSELYAQRLGRRDQAFFALGRAFHETPNDAPLFEKLRTTAVLADSDEELIGIVSDELEQLPESKRGALALVLGEICEQRLHAPDRAGEWYEQAMSLGGVDPRAPRRALERLWRKEGDRERYAQILESLLALDAGEDAGAERLARHLRLARLYREELSPPRPERAMRHLEAVLRLEPDHPTASRGLEELYDAQGEHERLFALWSDRRERAPRGAWGPLSARMARLAATKLGDPALARKLWFEVWDVADCGPGEGARPAYEALLAFAREAQDLEGMARLHARALDTPSLLEPSEIFSTREALAELYRTLGYEEEATAQYRALLEREPFHRGALEALDRLYARQRASGERAMVLRRRLAVAEPGSDLFEPRLALARELERSGQREEALMVARRLLESEAEFESPDPSDLVERLHQVEAFFHAIGSFADERRALVRRAERMGEAGDREGAVSALHLAASLGAPGSSTDRRRALPILERILEWAPGDRLAFDALRATLIEEGGWRAYASATERFLEGQTETVERVGLWKDLARVAEQYLGERERALKAWCQVLELDPLDPQADEGVLRLVRTGIPGPALEALLTQTLANAPLERRVVRRTLALAEVQERVLQAPLEAWTTLERLDRELEGRAPGGAGALEDRADVLGALAGLAGRQGKLEQQVSFEKQRLERVADAPLKRELLLRIATLEEESLDRPREAIAALLQRLELGPDREVFLALERLYRKVGDAEARVAALVRHRDFEPEAAVKAELELQRAEVEEVERQDRAAAIEACERALALDGERTEAMSRLDRLYQQSGRAFERAALLTRQRAGVFEPRERRRLTLALVSIYEEELGDLATAERLCDLLSAQDRTDLEAARALARIRRGQAERQPGAERWARLTLAYEREFQATTARGEKVTLLVAMGELAASKLDRREQAIELFQRAAAIDGGAAEPLRRLRAIFLEGEAWDRAREVMRREAELRGEGAEGAELFEALGELCEQRLEDPDAAAESYRRAVALDPARGLPLRRLKELARARGDRDGLGQWMEREAMAEREPEARARLCFDWGCFELDERQEPERAARAFEEGVRANPSHAGCLEKLAEWAMAQGTYERAGELLEKRLAAKEWANEEPGLLNAWSLLLEGRGARTEAAAVMRELLARLGGRLDPATRIAWVARCARLDPGSSPWGEELEAWRRYGEAYGCLEGGDEVQAMIEALATSEGTERSARYVALGKALVGAMGERGLAREAFEHALELKPMNGEAFEALEELLGDEEDWAGLEQTYLRAIRRLADSPEKGSEGARAGLYEALGRLYESVGGDATAARQCREQAMRCVKGGGR